MPEESSLFQHVSFATMSAELQAKVRSLFVKIYHEDQEDSSKSFDTREISKYREDIATNLSLYLAKLNRTDPVSFFYLNSAEKKARSEELLLTFYLLSTQLYLDEGSGVQEQHKLRIQQINQCAKLLYQLHLAGQKESPETILNFELNHSEKYLKYLGLTVVAPFLTDEVLEFTYGKTSFIKKRMDAINERRMYWVWGGGLLESVLYLIPQDFSYQQQAQAVISSPDSPLGYVSWILYYSRFGIALSLLLKHTLKGPWMSEEERKIPWKERFKTQWHARKFNMLNDVIWATVNLVTFFWLNGLGMLGYFGNVLTTFLLVFDLSLNIWRFCEEDTKKNAKSEQFANEIAQLANQIKQAEKLLEQADEQNRTKELKTELALLRERKESLEKTRREFELDWKFKQYNLIKDVTYATSLVLAFSVVSCMFLPPTIMTPLSTMILGVAGAGVCFILTIAYAAVSGSLDIMQARAKQKETLKDCEALIERFKQCKNDDQKQWMYLHMRHMLADTALAEKQIAFQKVKLIHSVVVDSIFPALVFSAFMFLPLGYGIGVMAIGLAIMALSHKLLNSFKPSNDKQILEDNQDVKEEVLDTNVVQNKDFKLFAQKPTIKTLKQQLNLENIDTSFFKKDKPNSIPKDELDPDATLDAKGGSSLTIKKIAQ